MDYKTDQDEGGLDGYGLQVRLYALALQYQIGRPVDRGFLYYLRQDKAVSVDLSPGALADAASVVERFRDAQHQVHFPLNEGRHCLGCGFYGSSCPAGEVVAP